MSRTIRRSGNGRQHKGRQSHRFDYREKAREVAIRKERRMRARAKKAAKAEMPEQRQARLSAALRAGATGSND